MGYFDNFHFTNCYSALVRFVVDFILEVEHFCNHDLDNIITPLNVDRFELLLRQTNYCKTETEFLVDGFRNGFDIGYKGPTNRWSTSTDIPFSVGDKYELWSKVMKEVKAKRFAGPFDAVPFDNFIHSPIGLVPKAGGKTRLIFHLSFKFGEEANQQSLNGSMLKEECSVHYNDLDAAVKSCLHIYETFKDSPDWEGVVFLGKTDLSSAFRVLPPEISCFCWLVMIAQDPSDGKWKYFIDKCLPFGASISCSHYQRFSNALQYLVQVKSNQNKAITNYLDDFLFAAYTKWLCDQLIQSFINLCQTLNIPVADEKTVWGTTAIIFLGILLDGHHLVLCIPLEKQEKALWLLNDISGKRKIKIKQLQVLTGYLNFLTKAIHPGRTFTHRIYAKFTNLQAGKLGGKALHPHHHIAVDEELHFDCEIWHLFLNNFRSSTVCRPMIDFNGAAETSEQLRFYSDASANPELGFGATFDNKYWLYGQWEKGYIHDMKPSIEYLELFTLTAAVLTWGPLIKNKRVTIFCDNMAVVNMINNITSSCQNCMFLIRLLILNNLVNNRRIFARHVWSENNELADALSHLQFDRFWRTST